MSAPAYTPGPWTWSAAYQTTDNRPTWTLLGADGYGILSCDGDENSPQGLSDSANAALIVAAPELYEALAGLLSIFDSVTMGQEAERRDEWLPVARAALAKVVQS